MERWLNKVHCGAMEELLPDLPADSIDCCVTDPPYGLKFMGKKWDHSVPSVEQWEAVFRVLKPGAHLLAFFGTRTYHRGVVAIEDAGFEIRDQIGWVYGSGFPKSLDVSKAIDKAAGVEREKIGESNKGSGAQPHKLYAHGPGDTGIGYMDGSGKVFDITVPATEAAQQWDGWGTALKPAWEPICVARKPLCGTVAENVLKYGTGGINIDGCRVEFEDTPNPATNPLYRMQAGYKNKQAPDANSSSFSLKKQGSEELERNINQSGRFPANIIHDGSDEVLKCFPETSSGAIKAGTPYNHSNCKTMGAAAGVVHSNFAASNGSAARFYYCAKASPSERGNGNTHPTVKPVDLIKYLVKLVCPRNGTVLDPFAGSCTTGWAAHELGMNYILIDKDAESVAIGRNRLKRENAQLNMFLTNRR